jgi:antitoxin (DNA-binding transcriptional repressor) of toxin-antitoxin stability system
MTEVSVRELKSHLAEYIRRAESGEEIAVTRRGRRVIVLKQGSGNSTQDRKKTLEEKLRNLEARGFIRLGRGKFVPPARGIPFRGEGPSASEMVLRDRR